MKYLVKPTEAEALYVSAVEAASRGCSGTTTHWYGVQQTANGQWCVMIDDDKAIEGATDVPPEFPTSTSESSLL